MKTLNDILKEYYRRFTHDWPPEWYTKEEAKNHPIEAGKFLTKEITELLEELVGKERKLPKNAKMLFSNEELKKEKLRNYGSNLRRQYLKTQIKEILKK